MAIPNWIENITPDGSCCCGSAKPETTDPPLGRKHDNGKPRMELLPLGTMMEVAEVLAHGANKYGVGNWAKGMRWGRMLGACLRHLTAFQGGEDKDPETGLHHLAHAACCILFLLSYQRYAIGSDDRDETTCEGTRRNS